MNRFRNLIKWLNLLTILATLLALLAPYAPPRYGWFLSFFGMAFPGLLVLHILFALFWLSTKNAYCLFSIGCMALSWNAITGIINFNSKAPTPTPAETLQVMSFNCRAFYDFTKDKSTKTKILQLLQQYSADVICFQEFPMKPSYRQPIIEAIQNKTGLTHFYQPPGYALAIFSRFPLNNKAILDTDQAANGCIYTDLQHSDGGTIRLYNVHLKSNRVSDDANKVLEQPDLRKKSTWLDIRKVMSKIKNASLIRAQQAHRIGNHIGQCPYPVVLCGDFNETPQSYTYRLLSNGLSDSFRKKGRGIGTTYAGKIPALRIDYILFSESIPLIDHHIIRQEVSDHYPLVSSFALK